MNGVGARPAARACAEHLSGYVLKKNSPSCGMERVKIAGATGMPEPNGRGLFAGRC